MTARLLVLTGNRDSASFRYRIEPYLGRLEASGIRCRVEVLPAKIGSRRQLLRQSSQWDGVFLHRKLLTWHDARLLRRHARVIVYDFDDAVMYKADRPQGSSLLRWGRFRRTVKAADLVIAGNPYLADLARPFNPRTEVLPTGVDTRMYRAGPPAETDGKVRLVWIGSQSTLPYLEQIRPALEQIGHCFPLVGLRIICNHFLDLDHLPVEKCPWSEEGHASLLRSSDIGLAPLPDNAFTRGKCGFKILQYHACGLPVVASPVGINSEYIRDGVTGLHATGTSGWVDSLGKLIDSRPLRTRMGQAAKVAVQRFDTGPIGRQIISLIRTVMPDGKGRGKEGAGHERTPDNQ